MSPDNDLNIIKPVPSSQSITVSSPVDHRKEKKQPRQEKEKQHPSAQQPQSEKLPPVRDGQAHDETNENKTGNHVIDYRA
jgi:hypothetical protein